MSEIADEKLLERWRSGDQEAALKLFDRHVDRLVALARRHLSRRLGRRIDAEDIVQSVFRTFFLRAKEGQFEIKDPDDLCKLLARITLNKTFRQVAFHQRAKRASGQETGQADNSSDLLMNYLAKEPTPDDAVAFVDQLEYFLNQLRPEDQQILELRMQGYTNVEIAEKLNISDRKIRRLLERMRGLAAKAACDFAS